ncbi:transcriptional regulator [Phytoactinopolyspora mesophila]|uniref:Transcriptional regulator n=1 Tax=Phytoactinopolyspora mesophila TaxID=2650750 RepID=A0A7K3M8T9_9ACTN|nr:transcriptional regulator [Phytoactinopolyspora mesophila]NDL59771.1 transcriptional regulator [Phytoactinopolyspora mesophila]
MGRPRYGDGIAAALALPPGVDARRRWRSTARARESFLSSATAPTWLRPLIRDSWERSMKYRVNPETKAAPVLLDSDEVAETLRANPLRAAIPILQRLLVEPATDAGVIVALADNDARVLWIEGDNHLLRKAEAIHAVSGSVWTEGLTGTNALGTAHELGALVQIFGSEHFAQPVHAWSCTAAPLRDPATGEICGYVDITGHDEVASPQSALLIRSVIAAVEAELRLKRTERARPVRQARRGPAAYLRILGRDRGQLTVNGQSAELSLRHTELLLLLAVHPDGLSAGELAWKMYEQDAAEVTVRAEVSRLRKAWPTLVAPTSPYRLNVELKTDAADVAESLQRGAYRRALDLYRGPALPRSEAPGVAEHRDHLHEWLRQALLRYAGVDVLLRYARSVPGRDDLEVWQACLERLPNGSRRRAEVEAAVGGLQDTFGFPGDLHRNGLATRRTLPS